MTKKTKLIFFSGPDGAGKSTTFQWAIQYFEEAGVKTYKLRSYQRGLMHLFNLRKKLKGEQTISVDTVGRFGYSDLKRDRDTGKFSWKIRRFIGLLTGIMDINVSGRLFVIYKRSQGYTVLVEESPVDIFVKRHRPQIKILEKLSISFFPKPDLSILCTSQPEAIFDRKPELNIDEIREYYLRINPLYNSSKKFNKIELRTDMKMEDTKRDLIEQLQILSEKH